MELPEHEEDFFQEVDAFLEVPLVPNERSRQILDSLPTTFQAVLVEKRGVNA